HAAAAGRPPAAGDRPRRGLRVAADAAARRGGRQGRARPGDRPRPAARPAAHRRAARGVLPAGRPGGRLVPRPRRPGRGPRPAAPARRPGAPPAGRRPRRRGGRRPPGRRAAGPGAGRRAAHGGPGGRPPPRLPHADPPRPWTGAGLAAEVGAPRAALAQRSTKLVGEPPMAYLTGIPLPQAADRLRESDATLEAVARRVGYGNAFALSTAFKREHGVSPQEYRTRANAPAVPGAPAGAPGPAGAGSGGRAGA